MKMKTEIFGHRGARGYFPENTITGFIEAVKMKVDWLELDVVVSKDNKVVVSHEPWMNSKFCSLPDGKPITRGTKFNLRKMNYDEIKTFDCGKRTNENFTFQKSVPEFKPLLNDAIEKTDAFAAQNSFPLPKYCIELKSFKFFEKRFQPPVKEFCELVYEIIKHPLISERVMIISFDKRVLQYFHSHDKNIKTGFTFVNLFSVKRNLKNLGYAPYAFNPYYKRISKKMIDNIHQAGMKINAWTVNSEKKMEQLIKMNVDGIMSDYPDVAIKTYNRISAA